MAQLKNAIEESKAINEELQKQYASLQENLKKVEAEKMVGDLCVWLPFILFLHERCVLRIILNRRMPSGLLEMKRRQGLLLNLRGLRFWRISEKLSWKKNALMIRYKHFFL